MKKERDILVKRVFPQLRKICEERQVTWGEADLRWGVTDEQRAEGQVLPICLEAIKRCRPYFIGLLGERYGWLPDVIPQELIDREPWLKEHLDHSVTELEILHGVLLNADMAEHAFFYFRDPKYVNTLSDKKDFLSENEKARQKLFALKERIRKSGFPVREHYPDPKALEALVLDDFKAVIDRQYPPDEKIDPLDRDAFEHDAYAQRRAQVYIGRAEYYKRLDEHVQSENQPLVVLGESGSGKSALLANWAINYRKAHPDAFLLMHFIGARPYSSDWAAMTRRIMAELKRCFDIQQEIPDKPDELRPAFANWLHMASAKGNAVIIIDALNQLEDHEGALDLTWLPPVIPDNVRVFLSTLAGRPLDELKTRAWPTLSVEPLNEPERKIFIERYLAQYNKSLPAFRVEKIAGSRQVSNPLYLKVLLEELRLFGEHEKLDDRINHYLEAEDPYKLYRKVLTQWQKDYEEEPGLVGNSFSLIWASRRGLSESELLFLLGRDGAPLPYAHWILLFLAARESLISRSGYLNFAHSYLRDAVRDAYVSTPEQQIAAHLQLADYFGKQELTPRQLDELPWQLERAGNWTDLKRCLTNIEFFLELLSQCEADAIRYFKSLKKRMPLEEDYFEALNTSEQAIPSQDRGYRYLMIGRFFELQNLLISAETFIRRAVDTDESQFGPDHVFVARDLTTLALLLRRKRNTPEAEKHFLRVLRILSQNSNVNPADICNALQNLALLYSDSSHFEEAAVYFRRALHIARESFKEDNPCIPTILFNLAGCLHEMNRPLEADSFARQAVYLGEQAWGKRHPMVAHYLTDLARHMLLRRPIEAERLSQRAMRIYIDYFGEEDVRLIDPLRNIADIRQSSNLLTEAEELLRRALDLARNQEEPDETRIALAFENLAYVVKKQGRLEQAADFLERSIQHYSKVYSRNHPGIRRLTDALEEIKSRNAKRKSRWTFW
jgi:nephrocystin-3